MSVCEMIYPVRRIKNKNEGGGVSSDGIQMKSNYYSPPISFNLQWGYEIKCGQDNMVRTGRDGDKGC